MKRSMLAALTCFILLSTICSASPGSAGHQVEKVRHTLKALDLNHPPTTKELMAAGQLGGQLYPTGDIKARQHWQKEHMAFGQAIEKWNRHEYKQAVLRFGEYLRKYPDSPWAAEAMLHIGCDARYNGRYNEAEKMFQNIVDRHQGKAHTGAKELVSKAKMRMGVLKFLQNNPAEAKKAFKDLQQTGANWRQRTYAGHWLHRIRLKEANQRAMLNCGVQALAAIMERVGDKNNAKSVLAVKPDSLNGHSLLSLKSIAAEHGHDFEARKIAPADVQRIPVPAIIQIDGTSEEESGHYWVLEKNAEDYLVIYDPQSRRRFHQTRQELAAQWDGVALIQADQKKTLPGNVLSASDMANLFGGCCGAPAGEAGLGSGTASTISLGSSGGGTGTRNGCGSPVWEVNMVNMNLYMYDIPMWYNTPIGPSMYINLSYNAQSAIAYHEPFGNKWQFNYATYLVEDTGGTVTVFMPSGQRDIYSPDGYGGYLKPYLVHNTLTKIADNHFKLRFPDDTVYVYNIPAGTSSQQPFLVEIRDAHGQHLTFSYNAAVELTTITDAMDRTTQLTTVDGLIRQIDDPFGRSAYFEYDGDRNLTKITDMAGYWFEFTYDSDVYLTSIKTQKGTTQFWIEPADAIIANMDNYPPPGDGMWENYRITVTHPTQDKEEFFYYGGCDSFGCGGYSWHVKPKHYVPWQSHYINNYRSNDAKTIYLPTTLASGQRDEVYKIIYADGSFEQYEYDAVTGDRLQIIDNQNTLATYTYNAMGQATSVTPAAGSTVTYEYNPANQVDLERIIRSGLGTKTISYNAYHQVTQIEDEEGHVYGPITYDSFGRIDTIAETFDGGSVVTDYDYFDAGVVGAYQLKEIKKDGQVISSYTYDSVGRVRTATDVTGLTLTYDYNDLDQVTRITYPDTKFIEYGYTSCCPHLVDYVTDRSGRTAYYEYDTRQRLNSEYHPGLGRTKYEYDANGNLTKITDANNQITRFEYDNVDRLYRKYDAADKYIEFRYNARGLLEKRINARNIEAVYGYNNNRQLTSIDYSDATPAVAYQYDTHHRLETITDALGTHNLGYYNNFSLHTVDGPWTGDTVSYTYDNLNRIKSVTPQGGRVRTYGYDDQGRLADITVDTATYTYGYVGVNPLVDSLTRPSGSKTTYHYNGLNQLEQIANKRASDEVLSQFDFQYNDKDLIGHESITIAAAISGLTTGLTSYDYNALNQLTSKTNPSQLFSYDDDGNMTRGFTLDGYAFTANYDANDRLFTIDYNDGSIQHRYEFVYGHDGFLGQVKKYENTVLVDDLRIVRDGELAIQERDSSNEITREYAWGLNRGGGIGGLLAMRQGGQDYNYLYDGKGNVSAVIDSNQAVVASYRYDSFGRLKVTTGTLDQPYQFSTKRYLDGVGLNYYGYRFYAPSIERWLNRDPISEAGGLNLYGFVQNNPVNFVDSYGLSATADAMRLARWAPIVIPAAPIIAGAAGFAKIVGLAGVIVLGTPSSTADDDMRPIPPPLPYLKADTPPGFWPGPSGAAEWGRRNNLGAKEGKRRFHRGVKQNCPESNATDDYLVNPETGDVIDPEGDIVGNLEDARAK
jgi:RHS repeat-associated protein